MAPSAITEVVTPKEYKMEAGKDQMVETHVHGAEDKTPLEAISHGVVMAGQYKFVLKFRRMIYLMLDENHA
jgi:hypothetical protein